MTHQGRQQVAANKEAKGNYEDRVIDLPMRWHCVGDDASHHHDHDRQQAEQDVHGAVIGQRCMQLHKRMCGS